ncbi:glycoside hydrolase family 43 protein [Pelagicoccus sp. SDUM812003]|uniref:glycoside hydrolase family 43 protein n=1 Tax=Pelagicoccus sp. SDUM812003 TaxID=3041267 RepID=UPI00280D1243|nr:glycoside hydrolase family 43 protein [Pelagicoccus sp. SDUM812003]MDQ8203521.1 glycoside hydrolase family 43 protein [Pelagicoccus sp. SDUM812003]
MATPEAVAFDWFEYSGHDKTISRVVEPGQFHNPILSGFYPDPSICRAGDDYYLVNSTFAYFPGLPIFHSKDLVNWKQVGNAIDRPSQLTYDGLEVSMGIFAPAITYHDGLFYLICTHVTREGNFVLTAEDPAGPWSDPYVLKFRGIDPSLFFDDDGRAWIVNNDDPEGEPLYEGHRAIRIQEFDLEAMQVKGPRKVLVNGGVDISTKPIWIEGPHLYKKDGWYYLSAAEGGTGPGHSQVVFRSKKVDGPYEPWDRNPILTQRGLPDKVFGAVTCTGHSDLVEGPDGKWWATFLGVRPYDGSASPMGRETFLMPVEWTEDGWPTILPVDERVPLYLDAPGGAVVETSESLPLSGSFTWRDQFDSGTLSKAWIMLRAPSEQWWSFEQGWEGSVAIAPRKATLSSKENPSYLARRVQHHEFYAETLMEVPSEEGVSAGLALFQNDRFHYFLAARRLGQKSILSLERVKDGETEVLNEVEVANTDKIALRVEGDEDLCSFEYAVKPDAWLTLAANLDARMITTAVAGGFVGATVGMHARLD